MVHTFFKQKAKEILKAFETTVQCTPKKKLFSSKSRSPLQNVYYLQL